MVPQNQLRTRFRSRFRGNRTHTIFLDRSKVLTRWYCTADGPPDSVIVWTVSWTVRWTVLPCKHYISYSPKWTAFWLARLAPFRYADAIEKRRKKKHSIFHHPVTNPCPTVVCKFHRTGDTWFVTSKSFFDPKPMHTGWAIEIWAELIGKNLGGLARPVKQKHIAAIHLMAGTLTNFMHQTINSTYVHNYKNTYK